MSAEESRKKGILFLILSFSVLLTLSGLGVNFYEFIQNKLGYSDYYGNGIGLLPISLILIGELILLNLVHKGKIRTVSCILIIFFMSISMFMNFNWGINLPQSLLMYCFIIVISGLLFNSTMGFIATIIIISFSILVGYLQLNNLIAVNLGWKSNMSSFKDVFISSITLSIIALVSWVSNREIEKSLARAESSERDLKKERDLLEIRVQERTKELQKAQEEKILTVYRFADLGRLAAGLMHDIVNPLTVVSLNLEQVFDHSSQTHSSKTNNIKQLRIATQRAISGTKQIEDYVQAARKQIQKQDDRTLFSICKEIDHIKSLFSYRCREEKIILTSSCDTDLKIKGSSVRLNQCLSNLVSNALDAHSLSKKASKTITISVLKKNSSLSIAISDNANGMPPATLNKVFTPFFTTKSIEKGTGIGLSMTKNIIEEAFNGTISATSTPKVGTTFTIHLPTKA